MKNPIRNETSLVLVIAVIFSAVAIPVLSGFLEPSQPPAVAAVQVGDPRDRSSRDDGASGESGTGVVPSEHRRPASRPKRERPNPPAPAVPAPSPPPDDLAEDDGDED